MLRRATDVVCALLLAALPALPLSAAQEPGEEEPDPRAVFSDRIDVTLAIFDVRVVDGMLQPVTGLGADDFRVRLGGRAAPVIAVDWIPAPGDPDYDRHGVVAGPLATGYLLPEVGERVVFLFQAGLAPPAATGHLRMGRRLQDLVRRLPPTTLAAVASYHSHLTLHQDLTSDRQRLAEAMELARAYHQAPLPEPPAAGRPSLARHLDPRAMRRVAHPALALDLVARALAAEPGPASIVYVGWSLGDSRYHLETILGTLVTVGIPLIVLDVADVGGALRLVAEESGGAYSKTREFPGREVARVGNMLLRGHYRLAVQRPDLPSGFHPLQVRLTGWDGYRRVLAPDNLLVLRRRGGP